MLSRYLKRVAHHQHAGVVLKRAQTTESLILFSWFYAWAGLGYGSGAKKENQQNQLQCQ